VTTVRLGSLVADQVLQVVLRVNFPFGEVGRETEVQVELSDRDGAIAAVNQRLTWEYADGRKNDLQKRDRDVDRAVARIFAARARQEAVGLNRANNFEAAAAALLAVAKRIRGYADADAELGDVVVQLEQDSTRMSVRMAAVDLKAVHFASYNSSRTRSVEGKSLKAETEERPGR
jgi:hypothetical protein